MLGEQGISCRVISMHTVKPIDKTAIVRAAKETKVILTVEEHSIIGGLGSAVAEVLAESNLKVKFKRLGVPDEYPHIIGSQNFLRDMYGLSVKKITRAVKGLSKTS